MEAARRKLQDQLTTRGATSGALRHSQAAAQIETTESLLTMGDTTGAVAMVPVWIRASTMYFLPALSRPRRWPWALASRCAANCSQLAAPIRIKCRRCFPRISDFCLPYAYRRPRRIEGFRL